MFNVVWRKRGERGKENNETKWHCYSSSGYERSVVVQLLVLFGYCTVCERCIGASIDIPVQLFITNYPNANFNEHQINFE